MQPAPGTARPAIPPSPKSHRSPSLSLPFLRGKWAAVVNHTTTTPMGFVREPLQIYPKNLSLHVDGQSNSPSYGSSNGSSLI